ncbi:MAG: hypothetical protein LAT68_04320 [Cyclobacteriaceae bacterium]|nr:hypothetical protein [Cyclobacteriaceae bacterium]MCH8515535.1 hypothetical protein [Cyclobacteriaceae bacterium]
MSKLSNVYISYHDFDNTSSKLEGAGWVSRFLSFLEMAYEQSIGEKLNVLRKVDYTNDYKLREIVDVVLVVVSPEYLQSKQYERDLHSFADNQDSENYQKKRIIKIVKYPYEGIEVPHILKGSSSYNFYTRDAENKPKNIKDFFSSDSDAYFWMNLLDLCFDIYEISHRPIPALDPTRPLPSVFLAETGHDLSVDRNIIKREFHRIGVNVLPLGELSDDLEKLETEVEKCLDHCNLSIHLIGSLPGRKVKGSKLGIALEKNRIVTDLIERKKLNISRVLWIPKSTERASEELLLQINNIKRDPKYLFRTEIFNEPIEQFKGICIQKYKQAHIDSFKDNSLEKKDIGDSVYLIFNKEDEEEAVNIKLQLESSGLKVEVPEFSGELMDIRKRHIDRLRSFDHAIVICGNTDKEWVKMKVLDTVKAPGLGRLKPVKSRILACHHPEEASKQFQTEVQYQSLNIIDLADQKAHKQLLSLLQTNSGVL